MNWVNKTYSPVLVFHIGETTSVLCQRLRSFQTPSEQPQSQIYWLEWILDNILFPKQSPLLSSQFWLVDQYTFSSISQFFPQGKVYLGQIELLSFQRIQLTTDLSKIQYLSKICAYYIVRAQ